MSTTLHATASLAFRALLSGPKPPAFGPRSLSRSPTPATFLFANRVNRVTECRKMHNVPSSSSSSNLSATFEASESEESSAPAKLIYLEGNSWLWEIGGANILVDPILVGPLDFGIPWLYKAYKRVLNKITLDDLPPIDYILITQSLDDHCHLNTLRPLSKKFPSAKVISTPNAKELLSGLFETTLYLSPGESVTLTPSKSSNQRSEIEVKAVAGPVLGPPWQNPENGYIVSLSEPRFSIFIEPHCQPSQTIENERADLVVTPVVKQALPYFTLVSGQEDAIKLAKDLSAKFIVPMANAELDASGLLSVLVTPVGTLDSFQELLSRELPGVELLVPYPGKPLPISLE